jgi:hypothetical protein
MLGWLTGRGARRETSAIAEWRKVWAAAIEAPDAARVAELGRALEAIDGKGGDREIEFEMVAGLADLVALDARLRAGDLPVVQTGHRVAGSDVCHFSGPASMPDDPAQPAGRVLWTHRRAIFAGGAHSTSLPWHRVGAVVRVDRDVLLMAAGGETAHRFRFNNYADALCASALARHLVRRPLPPGGGL